MGEDLLREREDDAMSHWTTTPWTRRGVLRGAAATTLAACTTQPTQPTSSGPTIDQNAMVALDELFASVPGTEQLAADAQGILVIPNIITGGLFAGGAYGEGALMVGPNRAIVDYYSLSALSIGFQVGASAYNQALFFLTSGALQEFRLSDGWQLGAGAAVVFDQDGAAAGINSTRINRPIVEVVFGQRGLQVGASFEGAKYNRIVR
jgi:lipid-binding SYLF domain-containing protein